MLQEVELHTLLTLVASYWDLRLDTYTENLMVHSLPMEHVMATEEITDNNH